MKKKRLIRGIIQYFYLFLEENHHSFLIAEHDLLLYEGAGEMAEYLAQALRQTSREAIILIYASALELACLDCYKIRCAPVSRFSSLLQGQIPFTSYPILIEIVRD